MGSRPKGAERLAATRPDKELDWSSWFEGQGDTDQAHKCATAAPAIGKALPGLIRSLSDNCPALAHRVIPLRCGIWSLLGIADIDQAARIKLDL